MVSRQITNGLAFCAGMSIAAILYFLLLPQSLKLVESLFLSKIDPDDPVSQLVVFLVFLYMATPFSVGYTFAILAAAILWGWGSIPIVYCGSVLGGWGWFLFIRLLSHLSLCTSCTDGSIFERISYLEKYRNEVKALETAITETPLKTCTLLQLSFLPFGILNTILALTTEVPFGPFAVACTISRLKTLVWIWVGVSTMQVIDEIEKRNSFYGFPTTIEDAVPYALTIIFSVVALAVIGMATMHQLNKLKQKENHKPEEDGTSALPTNEAENMQNSGFDYQTQAAPIQVASQGFCVFQPMTMNGQVVYQAVQLPMTPLAPMQAQLR